jgi:hypothetical protein
LESGVGSLDGAVRDVNVARAREFGAFVAAQRDRAVGLAWRLVGVACFAQEELPLFLVGFAIHLRRELILRQEPFAHFVLGLGASAATPVLAVLLLLTAGRTPLLGWGSLWQWLVMTAGGAVATPIVFLLFGWCNRALGYRPVIESSFRPDREIRRGR